MKVSTPLRRATGPVCLILFLVGCVTGPEFTTPAPPIASGYTALASPAHTAASSTALGGVQRFVEGMPIKTRWWRAFGSAELDALIEEALRASPTLEAAEATLRQARHTYEARAGSTRYPQANANLSGGRKAITGAAMGQPAGENTFNLFDASVNVRYNFDVFGGNRRALDAFAAQADYQRFQFEGAHLALAANVADAAIRQAQLAAQIEAAGPIEAVRLTADLRRRGTRWNVFGITTHETFELDGGLTHFLEGRMDASFGTTPLAMQKAVRLMDRGLVDPEAIITHRFPLAEIHQAVEVMGRPDRNKVIVNPQGASRRRHSASVADYRQGLRP